MEETTIKWGYFGDSSSSREEKGASRLPLAGRLGAQQAPEMECERGGWSVHNEICTRSIQNGTMLLRVNMEWSVSVRGINCGEFEVISLLNFPIGDGPGRAFK